MSLVYGMMIGIFTTIIIVIAVILATEDWDRNKDGTPKHDPVRFRGIPIRKTINSS